MTYNEKIRKFDELLISGKTLTTKLLTSCGLNSKDIKIMIEKGIIKRSKRGEYIYMDLEKLFARGEALVALKEFEDAAKCFMRVYDVNPNHEGACLELFYRSLCLKYFNNAFKYFDTLIKIENRNKKVTYNLFLYLLSQITNVPERYKDLLASLDKEDFMLSSSEDDSFETYIRNRTRGLIARGRYISASRTYKELPSHWTISDKIIIKLLHYIILEKDKQKASVLNAINEKQYSEIVEILEAQQGRCALSKTYEYILKLAKKYMYINESGEIPSVLIYESDNTFEAIDGNNFVLALKLNEEHRSLNNFDSKSDFVSLLLKDIIELIATIKERKAYKKEVGEESLETEISLKDIYERLLQKDFASSFTLIRNYLNSLNKAGYEAVIINEIKLSILKGDSAYAKIMTTLEAIKNGTFEFKISHFMQEFYASLSKNQFREAKCYLAIIEDYYRFSKDNEFASDLAKMLESTMKIAGSAVSIEDLDIMVLERKNKKETE